MHLFKQGRFFILKLTTEVLGGDVNHPGEVHLVLTPPPPGGGGYTNPSKNLPACYSRPETKWESNSKNFEIILWGHRKFCLWIFYILVAKNPLQVMSGRLALAGTGILYIAEAGLLTRLCGISMPCKHDLAS